MKLPTGRQLKAARALAGLEQRQVAERARIDASTLHRMEASGAKPVRGHGINIERVVEVLLKAGVELTHDPDGVRLVPKARKP
jgi:transcriptional regulator with XRE-family HTH domain